ncbi:NtaA/DmoA family FMN-dependent monooxygenase [Mycolicibacterium sp. P9-22]|uniref:NtaA/DmoA family FMN-dependent monooxygenase n=1 Tax=Mycolicibacterium sp. P9-22 TaxID=2024613 RepID=UPI0011EC8FEC|nr:NtaA/DmoA family FMN-dependent monooxygenase [Mycolicibacterium sp. P9-22]KAA0114624.1 LLM class flavin-dependent oxidoreductase [Mycolicibacterium sp. P9-22]
MSNSKFHLGYFTKFGAPAWGLDSEENKTIGADWPDGSYHIELARRLEAAKFDFILFEDTLTIAETYGSSMEMDLKHAVYSPKHDPMPLLALMAQATEHIGVISTASTTAYPPFLLARLFSTLDSLSRGRVGWNVVTSSEKNMALNFGLDALPPHATRYDAADEYLELATKLWESWEEGALVADPATGVYVDHNKVHAVDFEGKFHKSRGPLNTVRSPQVKPVICQAGASSRGRAFAAKYAEVIVGLAADGVEEMKAFRDDVRARMVGYGRNPDDCKIVYLTPVHFTGPTVQPRAHSDAAFEYSIVMAATAMDVDFSKYDLDGPVDQSMEAGGHTSAMDYIKGQGLQGKTLREALDFGNNTSGLDLSGTPEVIAEQMVDAMNEVGGDGFLIEGGGLASHVGTLTDELIPALQKVGAVRDQYKGGTLRDVLHEF